MPRCGEVELEDRLPVVVPRKNIAAFATIMLAFFMAILDSKEGLLTPHCNMLILSIWIRNNSLRAADSAVTWLVAKPE